MTQEKMNIVQFAVGDANGTPYTPVEEAVSLRNEQWRGPVAAVEIAENNPYWIVVTCQIPAQHGGFMIHEAGLYDEAGDLIAIGRTPESYKPVLAEGASKDFVMQPIIEVSNAASVTLRIDPNVIQASRQYVDDKSVQLNKHVMQSFQKSHQNSVTREYKMKPAVLFVDDDMSPRAYSVIYKEFVQQRNIPFLFGAISSRLLSGDVSTVTKIEFDEIKNNSLATIANHTGTHLHLATLTDEEIEKEIKDCEDFLLENGIYTRCLIPPYGSTDDRVRTIAKKFVDTLLVTVTANNTVSALNCADGDFLNSTHVRRIDFGLSIDRLKSHVDLAKQHNALLVITTHAGYGNNPDNQFNFIKEKLHELIDYIEADESIEIVDYATAYARFSNIIEYRENGSLKIGMASSGKTVGFSSFVEGTKHVNASALPSVGDYTRGTITKREYNIEAANTNGYPFSGTLLTHRGFSDTFTWQQLIGIRNNTMAYRTYDDQKSQWNAWKEYALASDMVMINSTAKYHANEAPTADKFASMKVTRQFYSTSDFATYGYPVAGTLETSRGGAEAFTMQKLYAVRTNHILYRTYDDLKGVWNEWRSWKGHVEPGDLIINNSTAKYHADELPTTDKFPLMKITRNLYTVADVATYGYPASGVVETQRGGADAYTSQTLYAIRTNQIFYRTFDDQAGKWNEWSNLQNRIYEATFDAATYPDVPTMTHARQIVNSSAIKSGDIIDISAPPTIQPGIMYNATVLNNGQFAIDIFNASTEKFNIKDSTWRYNIMR